MNVQRAVVVEHHWVEPIDQLGLADAPSVGGKAANLGELTRARFPVPAGFAVTAEGYLKAMDDAGVRDSLRDQALPPTGTDDAALATMAHDLRSTVLDAPISDALRAEILEAYRKLGGESPRVAVRSSAPAEDASDTSFAGIHDSFTDVSGENALIETIRKCWASLWSERALTYRSVQKVDDEPSIAVVVQLMVDADQSGVVFTADPRTGARDRVVVEAARGLGETVVGGQVEPDTYVVAKSGFDVIDTHIGLQSFSIKANADGERVEIPAAAQGQRVLDENQIERLAMLAVAVEDHYHIPQDLEFAFAGDRLWIVQTRPITTLGVARARDEHGESTGKVLVQGLGAGPGAASGRVRVLRTVADSHRLSDGDILVAPMTRPDWLPVLRRARAIVTDGGGITCHAAIVGRELGRPVVVGTRTATSELQDGRMITVDGDSGVVYDGVVATSEPDSTPTRTGAPPQPAPVRTNGGGSVAPQVTATSVYVNLATPDAAEKVAALDVDGVGLLRAEFMIMDALEGMHPAAMIAQGRRDEYVAAMVAAVERIAAAFAPRPVIYRAIDLRTNEFADLAGGDVEPDEDNPMIGYRGCFRYVREPELFDLDLDVLLATRKRYPNVHLMIPFVRTRWELQRCLAHLDAHPLGTDRSMHRWIMAEVPSVAYWIPEYAALGIDGVSIGTNDLTQLMLGVDRDSEICRELFDAMDPAVLDAIDVIIERATRAGLSTSLCGQAVSTDPTLAEHLVRGGITSVSVTPDVAATTRRNVAAAERRILLDRARSNSPISTANGRRGGAR